LPPSTRREAFFHFYFPKTDFFSQIISRRLVVYESTKYRGQSGWWQGGGASLSSPMIAARSANSGQVTKASCIYSNNITFRDITSGNNGAACLVCFNLCSGVVRLDRSNSLVDHVPTLLDSYLVSPILRSPPFFGVQDRRTVNQNPGVV
jgi:hypothetical protein